MKKISIVMLSFLFVTVLSVFYSGEAYAQSTASGEFCYSWASAPDLTVGNFGKEVQALKFALSASGVSGTVTSSIFDENTAADVVQFQAKYGIKQTGYVGPITRAKLNSLFGCDRIDMTPSITILSPNGGETFIAGSDTMIMVRWQTKNVSPTANLDVIRLRNYNTGQEYNLAYNVVNDGEEVVTIPSHIRADPYTLEIKTYVNNILVTDGSDSYFKMANPGDSLITVISPRAGNTYTVDDTLSLKWKNKGLPKKDFDYFQLMLGNTIANSEVEIDEGKHIAKSKTSYSTSDLLAFINLMEQASGVARDRVEDAYYVKVNAVKDDRVSGGIVATGKSKLFSIKQNIETGSTITVIDSGIKEWQRRLSYGIPIESHGVSSVIVRLSSVSGNRTYDTPSYSVNQNGKDNPVITVPSDFPLGDAKLYVIDANNSQTYGMIRGYLSIVKNLFSSFISSVSGPTSIQKGTKGTWTINLSNTITNAQYSVDWGFGYSSPSQVSPTFDLTYPSQGYYTAKFKVIGSDGKSSEKIVYITVTSPTSNVTLVYPNGGETFHPGDTVTFRWNTDSSGKRIVSIFNLDTRTSYQLYRNDNNSNSTQLSLVLPNNLVPGRYSASVYTNYGTSGDDVFDTSDSYFTITAPIIAASSITVLSPNGGETIYIGQSYFIRWSSANLKQKNVRIGIVDTRSGINSGGDIAVVPNTGSYMWTVPTSIGTIDLTSSKLPIYKIGVSSENAVVDDWATDFSNSPFSVAFLPSINVLSPNGGETWQIGSTHQIKWSARNFGQDIQYIILSDANPNSSNYTKQYVISAGSSITYTDADGSGQFSWTIPQTIPSSTYKMWIGKQGEGNATIEDSSDSSFTIN